MMYSDKTQAGLFKLKAVVFGIAFYSVIAALLYFKQV